MIGKRGSWLPIIMVGFRSRYESVVAICLRTINQGSNMSIMEQIREVRITPQSSYYKVNWLQCHEYLIISKARIKEKRGLWKSRRGGWETLYIPHFHYFLPSHLPYPSKPLNLPSSDLVPRISPLFASVSVSELQREPWLKNPLPSSSPRTKLPPNSNPHPSPLSSTPSNAPPKYPPQN